MSQVPEYILTLCHFFLCSQQHFIMKYYYYLDILSFGITFGFNFVLLLTFLNDPKEFSSMVNSIGSSIFVMVNGIGSAIYELVFAIATFLKDGGNTPST